jgi:predicted dehydrogenase
MARSTRRDLLKQSTTVGAGIATGLTILGNPRSARGTPAADKIILAAVGVGGRGNQLATHPQWGFLARDDCQYAYICDPDAKKAQSRVAGFAAMQHDRPPAVVQDFRIALDDKSVDAIVSATPDHWHALTTVWGCLAGKDVYVEKPAHHSCWEGQQMVKATRKHERVVQIGTQNRSAPYNAAARKYIEEGRLGTIHFCRVFNQKPPWGMTRRQPNTPAPKGLDWNIWNGPAPEHPYNAGLHRTWHHLWRYSGGDIANDASHQIDLARWLLGVTYPNNVYSTGGRFAANPEELVAETPDTQMAVYDFDGLVVSFELTLYGNYILKTDSEVRERDLFPYWMQNSTRIEIHGTEGMMVVGRHGGGWQVFARPKSRQPVVKDQMFGRFPDPAHKANFIDCIRTRERPNADVLEGHLSALWTHYANISYRLGGRKLTINADTERIVNDNDAMELFQRAYRQPWVVPDEI